MRPVMVFIVLLLLPGFCFSATIYVPDDHSMIQDAIVASEDGDSIVVRPGTYRENIDFLGKAITVKSEQGPVVTIIDGNLEGSVVTFQSGENIDSVLEGFTLIDGYAQDGGGVACISSSSPTIVNNIIRGNWANYAGGGIYCEGSSPVITGNAVIDNWAYYHAGGIAIFRYSNPTVVKNIIAGNSATVQAGGIFCYYESSPLLDGNTITGNLCYDEGGGIRCYTSSPTITNCILWGDSPEEIYVESGNPQITYSDIEGGWPGDGNIDDNPLFLNPDNLNYHLLSESPCINAGDPESPPDPDGTRTDMGALYFPLSPLSLSVVPHATQYHRGDTLGLTVDVTNETDSTISFQGWSEVETPSGRIFSPLLGPTDQVLEAHQTISSQITQQIPLVTPCGGAYIYRVMVGTYPEEILSLDYFEFFIDLLEIAVEVSPESNHYSRGDFLGFTVTLTNNEDSTVSLQGWTEGEAPSGRIISPLLGPVDVVLEAGQTISHHLNQSIPVDVPFGGPYVYKVRVGTYPEEVLAGDQFEFSIDPPNIDVEVFPDTSQYYRGGILHFMVTVTNREDSTVSIEGWSEGETPWGMKITPLFGPVDLILHPNQTRVQDIHHRIPIDVPFGGAYIYRVRVGTFPVEVIAEDYFEFFIVPGSLQ